MKKRKPLTISNIIEILELSKIYETKDVSKKTGFCITTVNQYKRKHWSNNSVVLDRTIKQLIQDENSPEVSYERISKCSHEHLFVKCPHCRGTWSEKDKAIIQAIIDKYNPEIEKIKFETKI